MKFLVIGNPENRRVLQFAQSLTDGGYGEPEILSYLDVLQYSALNRIDLADRILRIESPGENSEVRKLIIRKGLRSYHTVSQDAIADVQSLHLPERVGEVIYLKAWYDGFSLLMRELEQCLEKNPGCQLMNRPSDILTMFDKRACQKLLCEKQVPVPDFHAAIPDYRELLRHMQAAKWSKVFIKPAHASSASGVIAFRCQGEKQQAITTIGLRETPSGIRLFNSLKLKTYTRQAEIFLIIDRILAEGAIVETWMDKATIGDRFFDLRILVIAGKARHRVVRMSRQVITNLHLGNKRGDEREFEELFGKEKLEEACRVAEQAAHCFPGSLYCGVDVLIGSRQEVKILEVNAFGDLLPQVYHQGQSCYEAEIQAMVNRYQTRAA